MMKGITVKLPDTMLRRLRQEARATGRSVAALIRERLVAAAPRGSRSVHEITADLAGSDGRRSKACNQRPAQVRAVMITICDTGPLIAYLNRNDPHHSWAVALMKQVRSPMLTTEPVLTEVAYFLRADRPGRRSAVSTAGARRGSAGPSGCGTLAAAPHPYGAPPPNGPGRRVDCC